MMSNARWFAAAGCIAALMLTDGVLAQAVQHLPVPVRPGVADGKTLLLVTFDKAPGRADAARGNPALTGQGLTLVDGYAGKAASFGPDGRLTLAAPGNFLPRAGTIEMVIRNSDLERRHVLLTVEGPGRATLVQAQLGGGLWWSPGGGDNTWIRDVNIGRTFADQWHYVVLGWDCDRLIKTVCVYDMQGRFAGNDPRFRDSGKMNPQDAARFAAAQPVAIHLGSPGLILDTLRISSVYRGELLDPQRDWGPVEQWGSYAGQNLFDAQTLRQRWTAGAEGDAALPAPASRLTRFEPVVRGRDYQPTGKTRPPVPVVRCSPAEPAFELAFGELPIGCYVLRVIAAVRTEDIEQYRKPVLLEMQVNDQVGGGLTTYRARTPYWDEFYCVAEIYFNADEARAYRGRLTVADGSLADLHIHAVELHDVLAGLPGVAVKKTPALFTLEQREQLRRTADEKAVRDLVGRNVSTDRTASSRPLSPAQRQARDEMLWNAFPPLNSQFIAEYDEGFAAKAMMAENQTPQQVAAQHGAWQLPGRMQDGWRQPLVFTNDKLKLNYTRDDLAAHKPLPDPYPFKDRGTGLWFPRSGDRDHAVHFMPIAQQLGLRWQQVWSPMAGWHGGDFVYRLPYLYHALDDREAARDAAFQLARWAYTYPAHTDAQTLGYATISPASMYNRDMRLRLRATMFYWGSSRGMNLNRGLVRGYDYLFDFIRGNDELVQAVQRFIPWVRSDEDLRRLIETRVLQYGAKQSMRFQLVNSKEHSSTLLQTAVVQQDPDVTRPWMEALWTHTHIYPHPSTGLPDYISTTTQRDGTTDIGSVFYTWSGSPFLDTAALSRLYVRNGGDRKYDLTDFDLYGKIPLAGRFPLDVAVAGGYPMTIGDVGNPARPRTFDALAPFEDGFRLRYQWTFDPEAAWIVKHYYGRRDEDDALWKRLEADAAKQGRNPFLAQQSRVMANWAGIIETGQDSDDYRMKQTLMMRVGFGHGHAHADALDLQLMALGVRMLNDLGHRGSYNVTSAGTTLVHNRIEVNGRGHQREGNWSGDSYIDTFSPFAGIGYLRGIAPPPYPHRNVRFYHRGAALIEVDPGKPAAGPPFAGLYQGDKTAHDPKVTMPAGYVFDVQRIAGGTWPTFCFHGCWSDDFSVNLKNRTAVGQASHDQAPKDESEDAGYLRKFLDGEGHKYAGDAPDETLVATWRLRRAEEVIKGFAPHSGVALEQPQQNAEKIMLGADYRDDAPRRFTRLHLLGRAGDRVMVGLPARSTEAPVYASMSWPFLMVQHRSTDEKQEQVYPAVIEAYAGEPTIRSIRLLDVANNDDDALRAVAVEVRTAHGHTDVCFSDGRPERRRSLAGMEMAGQFAYCSVDDKGLRQAALVEGVILKTPQVTITLPSAALRAKIAKVDYLKRRIWLDTRWDDAELVGEQFEVGNAEHRTSFGVVAAERDGDVTVLTFDKPADISYARIVAVAPGERVVRTTIGAVGEMPNRNSGLTCTDEAMSRSWKARVLGRGGNTEGFGYQLAGEVGNEDLVVGQTLRVWEFGVGDEVRIPLRASVRRVAGAGGPHYVLESNSRGCRVQGVVLR